MSLDKDRSSVFIGLGVGIIVSAIGIIWISYDSSSSSRGISAKQNSIDSTTSTNSFETPTKKPNESYFPARTVSWSKFSKRDIMRGGSFDEIENNTEDSISDQHPEGPNIGIDSDPSWLNRTKEKNAVANKTDLLHTGHIKGGKLLIVMVGLPGTGKTYIARKVARYLRWISYRTRAFSLAKYRLDMIGSKSADFFDSNVQSNYQQRINLLASALDDGIRYLNRGGDIAIIDGTNVTKDRRKMIRHRVAQEDGYEILWIESINNLSSASELPEYVFDELKNSPDFIDKEDYERRLEHYKSSYQSLEEDEGSFIKVYGEDRKLTLSQIHGFLPTKIVSFVMNLHTVPRPVYIVRHGESEFNIRGLVGGDPPLTSKGYAFAKALQEYLVTEVGENAENILNVWTSTLRRARETASEIKCKRYVEWRTLREIESGVCDGLTYEQVKTRFPEEYRLRQNDKLRYRYPRGESYLDVINRLEPVIFELERQQEPIVIVAHQAVIRCLYAYFLDLPAEEVPFLAIPLHTVIKLEAKAYGCKEKRMRIVVNEEHLP